MGMSPALLHPPHMVVAPQSWLKELTSIDTACLMKIGKRSTPPERVPHTDKMNGPFP